MYGEHNTLRNDGIPYDNVVFAQKFMVRRNVADNFCELGCFSESLTRLSKFAAHGSAKPIFWPVNRLLHVALNLVIMGSIVILCAASLMLTHWGVLRLIAGATRAGGSLIAFAAGLAVAASFMIRNRNDLADR